MCDSFCLLGYQIFYSQRHTEKRLALLAVRFDLTYNEHFVPSHNVNEYVRKTVKSGTLFFAAISTYAQPTAGFDANRLTD